MDRTILSGRSGGSRDIPQLGTFGPEHVTSGGVGRRVIVSLRSDGREIGGGR